MKVIWKRSVVLLIIALGFSQTSFSQALFSRSTLTSLERVKDQKSCLRFEATFSAPLSQKPTAMVDVDSMSEFDKIVSKVLEVISVTPRKVQMRMRDPSACKWVKNSNVTVNVLHARGEDGRQILPSGKQFLIPR